MTQVLFIFLLTIFSAINQDPRPDLKSLAPFPVGAAISTYHLKHNSAYRRLLVEQFNSVTAENAMKFEQLHPSQHQFRWAAADELVRFARTNGMRVHGHTLIWSAKNPKWVNNFQGDRAAWKALLKDHIQTIVKHFKADVHSWDVVNEAFTEAGTLKKSIWLEKLGPEYLELAFIYAHEADPESLLFYNDYGHEYGGKKLNAILNMVKDFRRKNIPIHGLGLQTHIVARIPEKNIRYGITAASKSGLLIHISELEVSVKYNKPKAFLLDDQLAQVQAQKYKAVFEAYAAIPKAQQFGITTWNLGDRDAFRNSVSKNRDHPMLFDYEYQPKPAFKAIVELLKEFPGRFR